MSTSKLWLDKRVSVTYNHPMYAVVSADMEQTSVLNAGFKSM